MSPNTIQKVAIVGGSGNLGTEIVKELLDAGFHVTALSRESSNSTFPAGVDVKRVDYSSLDSVKAALAGQDALVSAIATVATGGQQVLADAAFEAGLKRIIPSEFGINLRNLDDEGLKKVVGGKIKLVEDLQAKSEKNPTFTWTGISNGMFFDWGLRYSFIPLNAKTKTASIFDSGNEPFSGSNLNFIARAVVSVLQHPQETANKYLLIAQFVLSLNELIALAEEETGAKWEVTHLKSADAQQLGTEKLDKGDFSGFSDLLRAHLYGDGRGNGLKPADSANELLGLESSDLKETIRAWLKEAGAV